MKCTIHLLYASVLMLGSITFGYIIGYPSPAKPSMLKDPDFANVKDFETQYTLFNSLASLTAVCGPFFSAFILRFVGRKVCACTFSSMAAIFFFMLYWTKGSYFWYGILCRCLLGFSMGGFSSIIPMYIVELAPPESSGFYGSLNQLGIALGLVIVYLVGDVCNWKNSALVCMGIDIALTILVWFIPESPAVSKNDQPLLEETSTKRESVLQKQYIGRLVQSVMMMVFQQFCGINAILTNLNDLFSKCGLDGISENMASAISGSAQVIAVVFGGFLVDSLGRKIAWSTSFGGISISLLLYALTFKVTFGSDKTNSILSIVFIFLFLLAFGLGAGAIPWFIISEIFPTSVRPAAVSIVSASNWILAFTVIEIYPYMEKAMTTFGCMMLFMACSVASTIFGIVYVKKNARADDNNYVAIESQN